MVWRKAAAVDLVRLKGLINPADSSSTVNCIDGDYEVVSSRVVGGVSKNVSSGIPLPPMTRQRLSG